MSHNYGHVRKRNARAHLERVRALSSYMNSHARLLRRNMTICHFTSLLWNLSCVFNTFLSWEWYWIYVNDLPIVSHQIRRSSEVDVKTMTRLLPWARKAEKSFPLKRKTERKERERWSKASWWSRSGTNKVTWIDNRYFSRQ